jgi:excinuclease UvrABC nuclease subunit
VNRIRQASVEVLADVPGMNKKAAQKVFDYFHQQANNSSLNE